MLQIMLTDKGGQHFGRRTAARITGEMRPIAQVPPTPHHRQIHTDHSTILDRHDDIDVLALAAFHVLSILHLA